MSQEKFSYSFEKIREQIAALESYLTGSPMQQRQAIEELQTIATSVKDLLEFFTEEMQANLKIIQDIEEKLLQQYGTVVVKYQVYHDLFKLAPNAYLVTNAEGIILEVNYAASELLNVLPNLLIGQSLINFVSQADHSLFLTKLKQSLNVQSVAEMEVTIYPDNRPAVAALLSVKSGREASGTLGALQISVHDITKYKQSLQPLQLATNQQPLYRLDGLRILIVDDEADTRELITIMLMQYGVKVTSVATVAEALQELERSRPDVLISDIRMPEEDGYALIRKIKALEAEKGWQIPTAALTAYLAEDRTKAIKAGFQSHLNKLAAPTELLAMVAQLAGRG